MLNTSPSNRLTLHPLLNSIKDTWYSSVYWYQLLFVAQYNEVVIGEILRCLSIIANRYEHTVWICCWTYL